MIQAPAPAPFQSASLYIGDLHVDSTEGLLVSKSGAGLFIQFSYFLIHAFFFIYLSSSFFCFFPSLNFSTVWVPSPPSVFAVMP